MPDANETQPKAATIKEHRMDSFALVVHDDQSFLAKVVNYGMEQGIFTRDRADEIIRISVAMANKYVLHKEVDFRSSEELAKVQETVLKLMGVGLEMKSKGNVDEGIRILMDVSPVELFRLAHTRIERLRHRWGLLLQNHRIAIFVSSEEYDCLSELTCQRLSEMSIFTEGEIHAIGLLTLEDELFSTLSLVEYYETELDRYEFILRLREILPFELLNRSGSVRAENLSEVDSIRNALMSTLIISGYLESGDPVSVSLSDVRRFLELLDPLNRQDVFSEDMENVLVDLIHELAEGLPEHEASLLTQEIIRAAQDLMDTIVTEWETASSAQESVFFKRWARLVILSDFPDTVKRILSSDGELDEFEFEILIDQFLSRPHSEVVKLVERIPGKHLTPEQVTQLFHRVHTYGETFAPYVSLEGFSAHDLVELFEGMNPEVFKALLPELRKTLSQGSFTMEELELLGGLPHAETLILPELVNPPSDYDAVRVLTEFRDASPLARGILFYSCRSTDFFPELVLEAWAADPNFVKAHVKRLAPVDIGSFLLAAAGKRQPEVVKTEKKTASLQFDNAELNSLFASLPVAKKKAVVRLFSV
jgi:hypothetical protein